MAAAGPDEALRLAQQHQGKIDLVITDVVMRGMNGPELADCLKEQRPGTRVLFMSGYTDNVVVQRHVLSSGSNFLPKPFRAGQLALKVRQALDQ